jgi:hypothetical protein
MQKVDLKWNVGCMVVPMLFFYSEVKRICDLGIEIGAE